MIAVCLLAATAVTIAVSGCTGNPATPAEGGNPGTLAEQLDSTARAKVRRHNDSLAMLCPKQRNRDSTWKIGGKKWGTDQQYIHLGPVSIPNSMFIPPFNKPKAPDSERLITFRPQDIQHDANREMEAEEMNRAIREEQFRKECEHEEQQRPR